MDSMLALIVGVLSAVTGFIGLLKTIQEFLNGAHARQALGIGLATAVLIALAMFLLARRNAPGGLVWERGTIVIAIVAALMFGGGIALGVVPAKGTGPAPTPSTNSPGGGPSVVALPNPSTLQVATTLPSATASVTSGVSTQASTPTNAPSPSPSPSVSPVPPSPSSFLAPPSLPAPGPQCSVLTIDVDQFKGTTTPLQVGQKLNASGTDPSVRTDRQLAIVVHQPDGYYPWAGPIDERGEGFWVGGLVIGRAGVSADLGPRDLQIDLMDKSQYATLMNNENTNNQALDTMPAGTSVIDTIPINRVC
jgi:hypothetical protein